MNSGRGGIATDRLRVAVAGIHGKMGQEVARAVSGADDLLLVGGVMRGRTDHAQDHSQVNDGVAAVPIYDDLRTCLLLQKPDVLVDFTCAEAAEQHIADAVLLGVRPVIGTTGFSAEFLEHLDGLLAAQELGGLYAPNFAVGAILMMRAAAMIAPLLPQAEIIEYHHEQKRDKPSGTAKKTAQIIASRLPEGVSGAIPIHSVRLPGFVAHQEIIFGGQGERLTIRHDSVSRTSFMPGVLLGIRRVMTVTGLIDGLEHFLF